MEGSPLSLKKARIDSVGNEPGYPAEMGLRIRFDVRMVILNFFEHIFGSAAHRANPTVRQFVKGCAGGDIAFRVPFFRIINVTTNLAFPFLHPQSPVRTHIRLRENLRFISIPHRHTAFQRHTCACSPLESNRQRDFSRFPPGSFHSNRYKA